MNTIEDIRQLVIVIQNAIPVLGNLLDLAKRYQDTFRTPRYSYENLSLDFTLDVRDGTRAQLLRRQCVRFLTEEAGVLRASVWGDGNQLARCVLKGARRLGSLHEGSRDVLLLGLNRAASKGDVVRVRSQETVADALLKGDEYFETSVERPTQRLSVRVLFPKDRIPSDAYVDSGGSSRKRIPVRLGRDGRARINWSAKRPQVNALHSVRWSW